MPSAPAILSFKRRKLCRLITTLKALELLHVMLLGKEQQVRTRQPLPFCVVAPGVNHVWLHVPFGAEENFLTCCEPVVSM